MFKLLPKEEKKLLHREYILRLAIVSLSFLLFVQVIGAASLMPAYFMSKVKNDQVVAQQKTLDQLIEDEKDPQLAEDLEKAKTQIRQLVIDQKIISVGELFEVVTKARPAGLQISSFDLTRVEDGKNELRIIGTAPSRDALVLFSKTLEGEPLFTKVDLPVSDFARSKDITFSILLSGTF